jgi:hypothetical protein
MGGMTGGRVFDKNDYFQEKQPPFIPHLSPLNLFPRWEQIIPTLGTLSSHGGNNPIIIIYL